MAASILARATMRRGKGKRHQTPPDTEEEDEKKNARKKAPASRRHRRLGTGKATDCRAPESAP